ncbi:MAG: ATP-dependent helicase [Gammaproteobacteria bacterium]|nr:ATP-dependent helicase [Gammaproteobacteria bacterium]MBU1554243.1 ATP-dependent helicase [Gammaproteobacteria bacterium]MBU2072704.1 ATP-dependent helicase [Gammaproteobacteria bacterium]MBU2182162.1 ATP-dependent helicase [Gammaproteobacteria bacterium]MBU2204776.1 ATP-dependent helicase [Gammaproteobacteria bacterium]
MAAQGLTISCESQQIIGAIAQGRHFVLSGGAGSGKTHTLIEVLNAATTEWPLKNIACITYTNSAADEILSRVEHPRLYVSTIHEFLWRNIKHFQRELKQVLVDLINDEAQTKFTIANTEKIGSDFFDVLELGIQYKEYVRLAEGIISHDELLVLAYKMYESYPKLCGLTKDTYPLIFVDEYQDTDKLVIEILLRCLTKSSKKSVIGFFGDAMQSIYDGSVENLNDYHDCVQEIKKEQNRRNPQLVINLANKLRDDGLEQQPSNDTHAPNMSADGNVKQGSIQFLYAQSDDVGLEDVRKWLNWDFTTKAAGEVSTKELNLTHNLIATKAGYPDLMRIYDGDKILDFVKRLKKHIKEKNPTFVTHAKTLEDVISELKEGKTGKDLKAVEPTDGMQSYIDAHRDVFDNTLTLPFDEIAAIYLDKDQLVDDQKEDTNDTVKLSSKRDQLIKHLYRIENTIWLYRESKFSEFIRKVDIKITNQQERVELKQRIENLVNVGNASIGDIIDKADQYGLVRVDDRLEKFRNQKKYVYDQVVKVPFSQFQALYKYLEGFTPFSTQHKTKGREFDNVLVVMDNGNWNSYNFEGLFTGLGKDTVLSRTRKIFYVCCTRAKENLSVYYHQPSQDVLDKAKEWFGVENMHKIS